MNIGAIVIDRGKSKSGRVCMGELEMPAMSTEVVTGLSTTVDGVGNASKYMDCDVDAKENTSSVNVWVGW